MAGVSEIVNCILEEHLHKNNSKQSRSNEQILYYNTVQTSWRPQLSSSKEVTNASVVTDNNSLRMERKLKKELTNTNKKWSLGRLFRKKKDVQENVDSSSDEDRKAGFVSPQKTRKKENKKTRGNKMIGAGFDHIVISPKENEIFLPLGNIETTTDHIRSISSFDRRSKRDRKRVAPLKQYKSSSEDEMKSHNSYNSSSISRYRSDESTGSAGGGSNNRKSRSARNERYYKRIGRDESCRSPQMLEESKQINRWKIKSVDAQVHNPTNLNEQIETRSANALHNSESLSHVPLLHVAPMCLGTSDSNWKQQSIQSNTHGANINKRSISYDNHMHLQNKSFEGKAKTPPTPPPRDPQRRLNTHHGELRPISYAFDKSPFASDAMNGRCVSDDRLWGPHGSVYQSSLSQRPFSTQPTMQFSPSHKWSEYDTLQNDVRSNKENQDYKYVTDSIPRSRKPIHIVNQEETPKIQPPFSSSTFENPPIIRTTKSGLPATPMQSASDFWKKLEKENSVHRGREIESNRSLKPKPRSVSCSRVEEPRSYHSPILENLYKNQNVLPRQEGKYWVMGQRHSRNKSDPVNSYLQKEGEKKYRDVDEIDKGITSTIFNKSNYTRKSSSFDDNLENNQWLRLVSVNDDAKKYTRDFESVVNGSLLIKPVKEKNVIEVSSKPDYNKTNSMPNYYQRTIITPKKPLTPPPSSKSDKFDNNQNILNMDYNRNVLTSHKRIAKNDNDNSPQYSTSNPPSNLEDAINELEAIYESLKLGDEDLLERAERRDIPTPTNFEKYAQQVDEYDEDDDEIGEPDVIKDDVVYRTIKHANNILKVVDPQPPFGIPLGPIPPSPKTDYLHVTPDKDSKKNRCVPHNNIPDVIGDDLAVRALRKDSPGSTNQPKFSYPVGSMKKKKATRTQSANIYTLIQRDAAKPSGGDLYNYMDFGKSLEKSGSMSDIREKTDDIPSTLYLLRNLQDEEKRSKLKQPIFRHPSEGGAVYNLPTVLKANCSNNDSSTQKPPIPLPRKSLSPAPLTSELSRSGMEEVLNQIAKEAKESSEKLSRDLEALRKEAIIKSQNPKKEQTNKLKSEGNIRGVENRLDASKCYKKLLCETVPSQLEEKHTTEIQCRKLEKEKEFLTDINSVSEAVKVCSKMLDNMVTKHPPVNQTNKTVIQENFKDQNKTENETFPSVKTIKSDLNGKVKSEEPKKITDVKQIQNDNKELLNSNNDKVVASVFEKIDPNTEKISQIAIRCMRQISELNNLTDERVSQGSIYDNVKLMTNTVDVSSTACKNAGSSSDDHMNLLITSVVPGQSEQGGIVNNAEDDIHKHKPKKECEYQTSREYSNNSKSMSSTNEENRTSDGSGGVIFSSSDCLKSTSPSSSIRRLSSSITSFNTFSSSDYIKSSNSSDTNPPSTDPIKTFSTTSCDVKSTSTTPNITNTTPSSITPSPPLNDMTPIGNTKFSGSNNNVSDYNSSEELAMIFGIDKYSPATTTTTTQSTSKNTGNTLEIANACDHLTSPSYSYTRNANNTTITAIIKNHTLSLMSFSDENNDIELSNDNDNNNNNELSLLSCCYNYDNLTKLSTHEKKNNNNNMSIASCNNNLSSSSSSSLLSSTDLNTMMTTTIPIIISNSSSDYINTFAHKNLLTVNPIQNTIFNSFAPSNCLDTILELHDDSLDEICMTERSNNKNDDDDNKNFLNFSNNIVINTSNDNENGNDKTNYNDVMHNTEFDSLNSLDESNPDSGNVSLNEFPVPTVKNSVNNTNFELSIIHTNSLCLEIPSNNNQYSFINQINIETTDANDDNVICDDDKNDDNDKNTNITSNSVSSIKDIINSNDDDIIHNNNNNNNNNENDDNGDDQMNLSSTLVNSELKSCLDDNQVKINLKTSNNQNQNINEHQFVNCEISNDIKNASISNNFTQQSVIKKDHNEFRQRSSVLKIKSTNNNSSLPCISSNSNPSKCLTIISNNDNQNQQSVLHRAVILACTYSIINNDLYTILALILAIILLVAFIIL